MARVTAPAPPDPAPAAPAGEPPEGAPACSRCLDVEYVPVRIVLAGGQTSFRLEPCPRCASYTPDPDR